jgi:hypothetical protein
VFTLIDLEETKRFLRVEVIFKITEYRAEVLHPVESPNWVIELTDPSFSTVKIKPGNGHIMPGLTLNEILFVVRD